MSSSIVSSLFLQRLNLSLLGSILTLKNCQERLYFESLWYKKTAITVFKNMLVFNATVCKKNLSDYVYFELRITDNFLDSKDVFNLRLTSILITNKDSYLYVLRGYSLKKFNVIFRVKSCHVMWGCNVWPEDLHLLV